MFLIRLEAQSKYKLDIYTSFTNICPSSLLSMNRRPIVPGKYVVGSILETRVWRHAAAPNCSGPASRPETTHHTSGYKIFMDM